MEYIAFYLLSSEENSDSENKINSITLADEWILAEFNEMVKRVTEEMENSNFSLACEILTDFTWSKFADWYLEIAKIEKDKGQILFYILKNLLILWHPFSPFVSEKIWEQIDSSNLLMVQKWPELKNDKKEWRF
jgi:valyl-tRNA synthetase